MNIVFTPWEKSTSFLTICFCFLFLFGCTFQNELEWNESEGFRWAEVNPGFFGSTGFSLLRSSKTNIDFSNEVSRENIEENRHYLNGSGVAVGDVTGNGLPDIYFASLEGSNRLYKNLGNFRFEDITDEAGVAHEGYNSTGVVFVDVNGNGHLDLLITSLTERNVVYINDGQGRFELQEESGLGKSKGAKTMALADVNGNGYLDLYITNYKLRTARDIYGPEELDALNTVTIINGEAVIVPPFDQYFTIIETAGGPYRNEIGETDELYFNNGDGTFSKADPYEHFFDEHGSPVGLPSDWGLTASFRDVTGNGMPDLYVANDFWTPDRFWINQGDSTFKAIRTESIRNMSFASMGVDFSDINRDGHIDFIVTEMQSMDHTMRMRQLSEHLEEYQGRTLYNRNSVYLNRGDTTFAQIAHFSGLEASEWSWATYFMDVNLDGYEDLIVATGYAYDYQDMDTQISMHEMDTQAIERGGEILDYPKLARQNKIFRNNGDLTFTDVSSDWGFDIEDISLGMALADLNNDGDLDIVINRFNEEALVYENRTNAPRIAVRLKGNTPNTYGIGAKIELEGGPVSQSKEMVSGGNYISGSQSQVVFAADKNNSSHTLTVLWPGGLKSVINGVEANRIYEIYESDAFIPSENGGRSIQNKTSLFVDISNHINHEHHENEYNDFRFQPLLPHKLSRLGPGVAWIDYNQNGLDDLLIASGKDGSPALYENRGGGIFESLSIAPITDTVPGDQTSVIGWVENGKTRIVIGSANYEQGNPNVPSAFIYSIDDSGNVETDVIPGILSTTGPVTAADYTSNGYLDLFVGGRHKPGQYPVDADSRLFRNVNGNFELDEENSRILLDAGLVTGAVFADFTGNGNQDLLISSEWGTLKLFENRGGRFTEITESAGFSWYKGWWNGIAAGDFTNNGLPDIIALNVGLNSVYQIRNGQPLRMYYDDFNWDGRLNILETYYNEELNSYVPRRKLHDFESIPTILRNVSTHSEYSESTIETIFDQDFANVPYKELNILEHMIFINTGDGFEGHPLPAEAQFSSAFSAVVADFDNDGNEDLFISQNFFSFPSSTPRMDAGRGVVLIGDGHGNFTAMSGTESGLKIYGEQRGSSVSDIDGNGRADLVVSQNSGQTKLFKNNTDKAGIRIRLIGPDENRNAVGSSIRLVYENNVKGPRRYVQAGSGYWSNHGTIPIMGLAGEPVQIEVTWFDGSSTLVDSDPDQMNYEISY